MDTSFGKFMKEKLIALNIAKPNEIVGCSADEIETIKVGQKVDFLPKIYVEFLAEMGHGAGGGSDYTCMNLYSLKEDLMRDLEEFERDFLIPQDAFVFMTHQGYVFWYFHTLNMVDDPVVYRFHETEGQPTKANERLSDFFEKSMEEIAPRAYSTYRKYN